MAQFPNLNKLPSRSFLPFSHCSVPIKSGGEASALTSASSRVTVIFIQKLGHIPCHLSGITIYMAYMCSLLLYTVSKYQQNNAAQTPCGAEI